MLRFRLLSILLLFFVSGCSKIQVTTDFNPGTDFSQLKTYRWLSAQDNPGDDLRINNEFVIKAVRTAVDHELSAKGYRRDDTGQADFVVSWFGSIDKKLRPENINNYYARYGYGALYRNPNYNPQPLTSLNTIEYEEGSLVIDLLDPASNTLLWRGTGSSKLKENQSENQVTRNVHSAVKRILEGFPPQ